MDIESCDLSGVDISTTLFKFEPTATKGYDATMFKAIPEKTDPYSIIIRDEVSMSSILKKAGELRVPPPNEPTKQFAISDIPKIQSREQELLLKIEMSKNKILFLDSQHSFIDEYMGNALAMITDPTEFLSTIDYPEYVKNEDNIKTIIKNIKDFDKVVHDTKFYASIERHGV